MKLKSYIKAIFTIIIVIGVFFLLIWAFIKGRKEQEKEQTRESPVEAPSRLSIRDGETIITLGREIQSKSGIITEPLELLYKQKEIQSHGIVLKTQDLINSHNSFVAAKTQLEKTQVKLEAARKSYERQKALYEDNQNVSARELESAEAFWLSNKADTDAAQEVLSALKITTQQQWGTTIASWVFNSSSEYDRLAQLQDVLTLVTFSGDVSVDSAPQTCLLMTPDGKYVSARFVSISSSTNTRIQGKSFFYLAPIKEGNLLIGMNVLAYLPIGPKVQGVVIPASALVWWQGKAWCYLQKEPEQFVRREVTTENPVEKGCFVISGFAANDSVVVQGAQLLLSEEFRANIQVGEE